MRILGFIFAATLLLGTTGCSIYKMNIRQGNIIEQDDVAQLRKGMTKPQVEFLLGRPLVNDTFDEDTWYYVNRYKHGPTGKITQQQLVVVFEQGKLTQLTGDFDLPESFSTNKKTADPS